MNLGQQALTFFKLFRLEARSAWGDFWSVFNFRLYVIIWLVCVIGNWLFAYLIFRSLPQENINLHYNIIFGIDLIGAPSGLFWLPLVGLVIGKVNVILAVAWHKRDRVLAYVAVNSAVIINVIIALALYSLYLINFVKLKF